eukprot:6947082-Alexandrium_andersonii.AAC.1
MAVKVLGPIYKQFEPVKPILRHAGMLRIVRSPWAAKEIKRLDHNITGVDTNCNTCVGLRCCYRAAAVGVAFV